MRTKIMIAVLALALSGCTSARNLFYRDVIRTTEIAEVYGDPKMQVCALFIRAQVEWSKAVFDEPTDGLISRAFRDYLAMVEAVEQEAAFEAACSEVVGKIAIRSLRRF